jgi:hypothetical protein
MSGHQTDVFKPDNTLNTEYTKQSAQCKTHDTQWNI